MSRLVLLNSANYERAEIPMDDSVSIVGPNNAGKTSLINALQFLLVDDRRQMDFGAHEDSASLRFYFPSNASYILLEAQLESGVVVMGCVGKGASHEYQHFAYAGSLRIEDYRRDDGTLVTEPDLREHLSHKGCIVQYFSKTSEFFDALYGRGNKKASSELDLRIYKLENLRLKKVFQQVLVRTLRLDRLRAEDVKKFQLHIFEVEYGSEDVDFNRIWHRAFDQVNADRAQYQVCLKHRKKIQDMEPMREERLLLRGKITTLRPQIDKALDKWEDYRLEKLAELSRRSEDLDGLNRELREQLDRLAEDAFLNKNRQGELDELTRLHQRLDAEFALAQQEELEGNVEHAQRMYEAANAILMATQGGNLALKEKDHLDKNRQIAFLEQQLQFGEHQLGVRLHALLSQQEMDLLYGLLQARLFSLPLEECGDLELFAQRLRSYLKEQGDRLDIWGLRMSRSSIAQAYTQSTPVEIKAELAQRRIELDRLEEEIATLRDRSTQESRVMALRTQAEKARQDLSKFMRFQELVTSLQERKDEVTALHRKQELIHARREEIQLQQDKVQMDKVGLQDEESALERQHNGIASRRRQRRDGEQSMLVLADLPHTTWFSSQVVTPESLEEALRQQNEDCKRLVELDGSLRTFLHDILQYGFTKFQGVDSEDEQLRLTMNYANNLENENEALQRQVLSAVTTVASSLKELQRQYEQFGEKIKEFNRIIGKRHLSDLGHFRIEIQEQPYLLEAIRQILSSSEAIDTLESPSLFDTACAAADAVGSQTLDRAKDHLLHFCANKGSLKLEHLFELEFEVAKVGQPAQRFDQLDKIGSNGTVLMAKLISGLALLYKMLAGGRQIQTICYLDEAASLDDANQISLIDTAKEFGFNLLFASPTPQNTVHYCVPIEKRNGKNLVTRQHWQIFESLEVPA
jgi:hypothetical protein